jgi:predicted ATPase
VLFDRGVPDCIAYAAHRGLDLTRSTPASKRYRYNHEVLLLEPWEEIYTMDEMRTMAFAPTLAFHEALVNAYERAGCTLVPAPAGVDPRPNSLRSRVHHPRRR